MKNSRIATKLGLYLTTTLLLFAITIGTIFFFLFKHSMMTVHREELTHYAQAIAQELTDDANASSHQRMMSDTSAYLRFIQEVAGDHVWLVDEAFNLLATGESSHMGARHAATQKDSLRDLPSNAEAMIPLIFQGETRVSEGFNEPLNQQTLTVGAPIRDADGNIWGAILIHSAIDSTKAAINQGLKLLGISLLIALLLALVLVSFLAYSFTKPLSKMKVAALRLAQGDYQAKTNVSQKDEIGELSQAIDTLALQLAEASQASEKLEQMRQEFVANISHELRTPITVMRGSLEALTDKVITEPEKVEAYHQQMLTEAKFLERLVGDLLDLARLQNLDFTIEKTPLSLQDVLKDALRSAEHLSRLKEITLDYSMTAVPLVICGDYGRLRQMFLVILDNAIKFSPKHSRIRIQLTDDRLIISDQGPGIEASELPYIFDRFHKTYGEKNKIGTGLGLSIAKQIAQRHQMTLQATNAETGGARFTFDFSKVNKLTATHLEQM